ncbi:(2Fe-2S)-binding protein [Kitasatospora sp. LaBMicrA B282]|uniref:(2Fe-2S)-binding protein n=1 Tax=Kitasatospora sp. LaBMicrA B282 TaxID=3420949 RepID=UPI003D1250E9
MTAPDPLRAVGSLGPYFALAVGGTPDSAPPPGFRPLAELYRTGPDAPLAERVRQVADRLHTREPRLAASTLQLGLAARFWSVAIGAALLGDALPDLDPDTTHWWQPAEGPLELWVPHPATRPPRPATAEELHRQVVTGVLAPLGAALRTVTPVAEPLLWGNAASALLGTLRVLPTRLGARRAVAAELAGHLLARAPLAGALEGPPGFKRRSCCLFYRIPGGGLCGDCTFSTPPGARR